MTNDLVSWLRTKLDEDERLASRVAPSGNWLADITEYDGGRAVIVTSEQAFAQFMVHFDPTSVLADIAAKRAILDRLEDVWRLESSKPGYDAVARLNASLAKVQAPELERVVRLLASAYADRPGYREEWRP